MRKQIQFISLSSLGFDKVVRVPVRMNQLIRRPHVRGPVIFFCQSGIVLRLVKNKQANKLIMLSWFDVFVCAVFYRV